MAVTLLEMRDRVRQRTGLEHDQDFVTDTELNQLINLKYQELYGLLERHGLHRASKTETVTANGATNYSMPLDFWAVLAVFRNDSGVNTYLERHDHRFRPGTQGIGGPASSYRMIGTKIEFDTIPTSGTYYVVYLPIPAELTNDLDTLDGVLGWEEYVVVACAIAVGIKDKVDVRDLWVELGRLETRIIDEVKASEMSENPVVQNVRLPRTHLPGGNRGVTGYWGSPSWLFRGW